KRRWLLIASLCFLIGVLAKKSIFPLVILIPISQILFAKLTWKQAIAITVVLVLPGAIVAGDSDVLKILLLFIVPLTIVLGFYYIQITVFSKEIWKEGLKELLFNRKF